MGNKRLAALSTLLSFALAFGAPLLAQEAPQTQTVSWDPVNFALEYRLEIQDSLGATVHDETTAETSQTFSLPPGNYRYRITAYNVLARPEITGEWADLTILSPELAAVSPQRPTQAETGQPGPKAAETEPVGTPPAEAARDKTGEKAEVAKKPPVTRSGVRETTVSLAWVPSVPLLDEWYAGLWQEALYPVGLAARATADLLVFGPHAIGLRAGAGWNLQSTDIEGLALSFEYRLVDLSLYYSRRILPRLDLSGGAGGGIAWSWATMSSDAIPAREAASMDPSVNAFLEARWLFTEHLGVSAGLSFVAVLYGGQTAGWLAPNLSGCWKF